MHHRRRFLQAALGAAAITSTAQAIEPIPRGKARPHLRLSFAAYSYRKYLNLQAKPKPEMSLEEFIDAAALMPFDAVELTGYYFAETTPQYLARIKGHATRLGLDISGTAVGNNFCHTDPEKLKQQIAHTKSWIEHTSRLGGKTLRIFAGNVEKNDTEERAKARCLESIHEVCEYAGQFGVILALENHGGITATAEQTLGLVQAIKSPWFGVNIDSGNFRTSDPYGDMAKISPYGVNAQLKTEIQRMGQAKEEADLQRKIDILVKANYRGYVALEYEAEEEPKVAVPKYAGILAKMIRG